jgi:hypothetical protein
MSGWLNNESAWQQMKFFSRGFVSKRRMAVIAVAAVFLLLAVCTAAGISAFRNAARWLIVCDRPPPSLNILLAFGGDAERYLHSRQLLARYPDAFWIISTGYFPVFDTITLVHIISTDLLNAGIDTSRVLVNDTCQSTGGEIDLLRDLAGCALDPMRPLQPPADTLSLKARLLYRQKLRMAEWFRHHPIDSVLNIGLVSHPYHMRRIRLLVKRGLSDTRLRFFYLPMGCTDETIDYSHLRKWWKYETDMSFIIGEYIKMLYYSTIRGRVKIDP